MPISKSRNQIRAVGVEGSRDASRESLANREESVKQDLTRRMKCVCPNFSSGDFETLVADMTREQLRGERVCGSRLRPC
jgi:hypothetical protein